MCAQTPLLSSLMTPESHLCTALVPRGDDGLPLHDLSRILELLQCECKHQFLPNSIPCRQYFSWTINLFSWHLSRFLGQQPLRLMWPGVIMLILCLQACGSMCRRSGKTVGGSGQPPPPPNRRRNPNKSAEPIGRPIFQQDRFLFLDLSPRPQTHLLFGCSVVGVTWKKYLEIFTKKFIPRSGHGP